MEQNKIFWQEYQTKAWSFAKDESKSLEYLLAGLVGEAGEVAEKIKKRKRGDYVKYPDNLFENDLVLELGDSVWYPFALATHIGVDLANSGGFVIPPREKVEPCKDLTAAAVLLNKSASAIADIFITGDELISEETLEIIPPSMTFRFANAVKTHLNNIAKLAATVNYDIYGIAARNVIKLSSRQAKGTIAGSGDNR